MTPTPNNSYIDRIGRIVFISTEEILGKNELEAVLQLAHLSDVLDQYHSHHPNLKFNLDHLSFLITAFESAYGTLAGGGLFLRVGRACIKYGLREFGHELGVTDMTFRLLPLPTRIKIGSEKLAGLFNQITEESVNLEMDENHIHWQIKRCPLCLGRQADNPCCFFAVGLLQEALYWVSGGKTYLVEEKKCIACGDSACTIVVDRTPMS
jgi:predicted hydrocarbon binding protein